MARETKAQRLDREAKEAAAAKTVQIRSELQNLKDRVAVHQADEIAASFARLDALLADG